MKKFTVALLSLFFSVALLAQSAINDPNVQKREVKGFNAVKVSHGIELILTQGSEEAVAVSAAVTEDRDKIKTVVENGVLRIFYDHDSWKFWKNKGNKKLKAYVSIINIKGVDASSGSSVKVEGVLKSSDLDIEVSSGASFTGKVDAAKLNVDQSSGSVMNIAGTAGLLKVEGSSGSVFHGYELTVENGDADTSSGAVVQLTVKKELSAEASSGGSISYKGEGVIRTVKTSSGGSVSRKG